MGKVNDSNKLTIQMLIAMVSGILVGLLYFFILVLDIDYSLESR